VSQSYKFDHGGGFVELLAAEQSFSSTSWYQGTADAVRKNLQHFKNNDFEYALILSGDQLYQMDFQAVLQAHIEHQADLTVATIPVAAREASALRASCRSDPANRIHPLRGEAQGSGSGAGVR
jgi:glucose-1-phosphate adenylyltransferase